MAQSALAVTCRTYLIYCPPYMLHNCVAATWSNWHMLTLWQSWLFLTYSFHNITFWFDFCFILHRNCAILQRNCAILHRNYTVLHRNCTILYRNRAILCHKTSAATSVKPQGDSYNYLQHILLGRNKETYLFFHTF